MQAGGNGSGLEQLRVWLELYPRLGSRSLARMAPDEGRGWAGDQGRHTGIGIALSCCCSLQTLGCFSMPWDAELLSRTACEAQKQLQAFRRALPLHRVGSAVL